MEQLPVYVINLDRRRDRWTRMQSQFDRLGIEATRISAVDATLMPGPAVPSISAGEQACVASHCDAIEAFLATDYPAALILEDDVDLSSDVPTLLRGFYWWPLGARVVKLDVLRQKPRVLGPWAGRTPTGRGLHRIWLSLAGAGAYIVDRKGGAMIVAACRPPSMAIDHVLFDLRRSRIARLLRPCQIVPAMAVQRNEGSDIEHHGRGKPSTSLLWAVGVFLLRLVGKARKYPVEYEAGGGADAQ